jgi:hypothetical protein
VANCGAAMRWVALAALLLPPMTSAQAVKRELRWIRATITVDLTSVSSNARSHTHVTVPGAVLGAECMASLPGGYPDQVFAVCHVDSPGTIDLHVCNLGTPYDPPSGTYSVRVFNP